MRKGEGKLRDENCPQRAVHRQCFGVDASPLNDRMGSRQPRQFCALDKGGKGLLRQAMD